MSSLQSNPSKIVMISPFTSVSGSAIRFWNMAIELVRHDYEVVYVDRKIKNGKPLYHSRGITYYSCPQTGYLFFDIIISSIFNLFVFLRHRDCPVLYTLKPAPNNGIVSLLAFFLKKRQILDIDDLDFAYFPEGSSKYRIYKFFFDLLAKRFPIITYHTPNLRNYLVNQLNIDEEKLYYLPQGVTEAFLRINSRTVQRVPRSIIYVATLGITSDFEDCILTLVNICKDLPNTTIHVVGDGVQRKKFESQISQMGLEKQIIFTGRMKHERIPDFVAQHQIGINYMRKTPANDCRAILKVREYLACGLQVVCNNCGDVELFKDVVYIEKSIDSMETTIRALLKSPFRYNEQGVALMEEQYRWNLIMSDFIEEKI
ncbi:MAG: glycosyltransferase [Chitinispirillaceae bacterium]|nr:glycosyltransferase [Chitinispirillaceae bacterium]